MTLEEQPHNPRRRSKPGELVLEEAMDIPKQPELVNIAEFLLQSQIWWATWTRSPDCLQPERVRLVGHNQDVHAVLRFQVVVLCHRDSPSPARGVSNLLEERLRSFLDLHVQPLKCIPFLSQ